MMQKCYDLLNTEGVWVSYCAKGQVRRNLQQVGFQVERLQGPPGKREMLRAIKQ
jgi:tRNA U34 5-methylaminomethyl-2-thiouridine-forming methyltransferase MnmC